jgi:hypothetical protein
MIEVRLSPDSFEQTILTFDGRVLEVFHLTSDADSQRLHTGHIRSIELAPDRKGRQMLEIRTEYHKFREPVSDAALPKTRELVDAVQRAIKLSI